MNKLFNEEWAIVGVIDPDAYAAGTNLTAAIDMSKWEQLAAVILIGDRSEGVSVDFAFQSAAASAGSYSSISGKSMTQIADTSPLSGASNKQVVVNLRSGEVTNNNRYVKGLLTLSKSPTANTDIAVVVFGRGRFNPASDNDLPSVTEIVQ